ARWAERKIAEAPRRRRCRNGAGLGSHDEAGSGERLEAPAAKAAQLNDPAVDLGPGAPCGRRIDRTESAVERGTRLFGQAVEIDVGAVRAQHLEPQRRDGVEGLRAIDRV